jgi:aryl-alcohol dehydrogenase-like predicted oxidoreductase
MDQLVTRPLGKTGVTVTRLSAGGHFTNGPTGHEDTARRVREINYQIDSGITYFDIQWDPEELAMAEVMKTRARDNSGLAAARCYQARRRSNR